VLDERAYVNGIVALHATGGSTNHVIHLIAMARAGGIVLTMDDFAALSEITPLLCRIYPNGSADVNHFSAAGGTGYLIGELLDAGLLHPDANTVAGCDLSGYRREPVLDGGQLTWRPGAAASADEKVLRSAANPFSADGGLRVLDGNLGRAVIKISAVAPEHRMVHAPARVFHSQHDLEAAFKAGELFQDLVAVVRFQGPHAIGMPELHKLTPLLSSVMARGHQVALVTDGRMSGASGKVPAAIHLAPEAVEGGPISRLRDGDMIRLDAAKGILRAEVDAAEFAARTPAAAPAEEFGCGRELFSMFRRAVSSTATGASIFS